MKQYQFQILRYVHDQFSGEFVNLGAVVYSPEEQFLEAKVCTKYSRITAMFPNANGKFISSQVKKFEAEINKQRIHFNELFKLSTELQSITGRILSKDNSALQLTDVEFAVDIDFSAGLHGLYADLIEKYLPHDEKQTLTDDDVWKRKYKTYFEKYQVSNRFKHHQVKTKNDSFLFEKSWKNEIWHCYQPISFDMQSQDSIKEKVYKWAGKLHELQKANEKLHLVFMMSLPSTYSKLFEFINNQLSQKSESLEVEMFNDNQAEELAKLISIEMEEHDNSVN